MRALLEPHSLEQHRALDAGATVSLDQVSCRLDLLRHHEAM